jgi:asparagine N-glycosylation enzyme membrane subunit Stt3
MKALLMEEKNYTMENWIRVFILLASSFLLGFLLISWIDQYAIILIILLFVSIMFVSRAVLKKIIDYINDTYKSSKLLGILLGIFIFLSSPLISIYLLFKSIWDLFVKKSEIKEIDLGLPSLDETMPEEEAIQENGSTDEVEEIEKNVDKFPPTEQ